VGMLALGMPAGSLIAIIVYLLLRSYWFAWRLGLGMTSIILCTHAVLIFQAPESHRWQLAHRTPAGLSICFDYVCSFVSDIFDVSRMLGFDATAEENKRC
jgi:hypothetical protein